MPKIRILFIFGALATTLTVLGVATLGSDRGEAADPPKIIYMSAVEFKGGTDAEAFPAATAPAGGGYVIKPPDANGRWETSTYRWDPGTIVVDKGDDIELWIWGVNGSQHPATIEGYVPEFTVTRGNMTVLKFNADKEGIFRITCHAHQPSMEAQLVVMSEDAQANDTPTATPTKAPSQLPQTGGAPDDGGSPATIGVIALAALAAAGILGLMLKRGLQGDSSL